MEFLKAIEFFIQCIDISDFESNKINAIYQAIIDENNWWRENFDEFDTKDILTLISCGDCYPYGCTKAVWDRYLRFGAIRKGKTNKVLKNKSDEVDEMMEYFMLLGFDEVIKMMNWNSDESIYEQLLRGLERQEFEERQEVINEGKWIDSVSATYGGELIDLMKDGLCYPMGFTMKSWKKYLRSGTITDASGCGIERIIKDKNYEMKKVLMHFGLKDAIKRLNKYDFSLA